MAKKENNLFTKHEEEEEPMYISYIEIVHSMIHVRGLQTTWLLERIRPASIPNDTKASR
jgi:hypothetical protein